MDIGRPRRYSRFGITLLRAALGAYFLLHAYFVWTVYGIAGFSRLVASAGVPLPEFITWLTLIGHAIGGLILLVGYFSRLGAFLNLIIMTGALVNVHLSQGFFLTGIVIDAERGRAVAGGGMNTRSFSPSPACRFCSWGAGRSRSRKGRGATGFPTTEAVKNERAPFPRS